MTTPTVEFAQASRTKINIGAHPVTRFASWGLSLDSTIDITGEGPRG